MAGDKTRCGGRWTEAQFRSFIKGNLRRATQKWAPIHECVKAAKVGRNEYQCAGCGEIVPSTIKNAETGKREKNIHVDHIKPVIDPALGFTTWDDCIENLFSELDNLQLLCSACHKIKTDQEKQIAKERRANAKTQ